MKALEVRRKKDHYLTPEPRCGMANMGRDLYKLHITHVKKATGGLAFMSFQLRKNK